MPHMDALARPAFPAQNEDASVVGYSPKGCAINAQRSVGQGFAAHGIYHKAAQLFRSLPYYYIKRGQQKDNARKEDAE
jgi:hypothetical protein